MVAGRMVVGRDEEGGGAVAGGAFHFAAGRALAAVGDDGQNLAGAAGGDGVQGGFDGASTGAQGVGDVRGEDVGAQVQGGGHDGGALLFGVGGRGAGEDEAVDGAAVAAGQAVGAGGYGHSDAVLVKVGYRPFLGVGPALRGGGQAVAGDVGAVGGDAGQNRKLLCVVRRLFLIGSLAGGRWRDAIRGRSAVSTAGARWVFSARAGIGFFSTSLYRGGGGGDSAKENSAVTGTSRAAAMARMFLSDGLRTPRSMPDR